MPTLRDRSVSAENEVFVYAHTRWSFSLTGLGNISTRTELYLTAKQRPHDDTDAQAILQVSEGTGLIAINGSAVSVANQAKGTLTVDDQANGDITVTVEEDMTGLDQIVGDLDVKMITATAATEVGLGSLTVLASTTRAVT